MKSINIILQLAIAAAAGCGVLFILSTGDTFDSFVSAQVSTKLTDIVKVLNEPIAPIEENVGLPARILIPSIKVNATIDAVGLLPDGSMGVPKIPSRTAWFNLGPRPGEVGSATISGHVNWWNGATGSFEKLSKLKSGDKVSVKDDRGHVISFVVRKIRLYGASENAADVFFSSDGKAHLNLITCAGVWNKRAKQYTKRLVVFTDKVSNN